MENIPKGMTGYKKLGITLWNISHSPRTFAIKPHRAKKNPTQLFLEFDLKQRQISNKQPRTGHKIHLGMCLAFPPRLFLTVHFIMSGSWIWESSKIMERVKKPSNPTNLWDNGDWKKWPRAAFPKLPLLLKSMHNISFHLYPALHSRTKNNQSWGGTTSHLIKSTRRGSK